MLYYTTGRHYNYNGGMHGEEGDGEGDCGLRASASVFAASVVVSGGGGGGGDGVGLRGEGHVKRHGTARASASSAAVGA